jgi:nucleoside-diphosphate-sugar epimerase
MCNFDRIILKKILVTGANGFLGRAVSTELIKMRFDVTCVVRRPFLLSGAKTIRISDLERENNWSSYLDGIDCIIHTAARAHVMNDTVRDPLEEFDKVNVIGTMNLAKQAAKNGVRRFIFISSIGVNGNCNTRPFLETDIPSPQEPYAVSKYKAEQKLKTLAKETGLQVVIIRPPLVYGYKAPGNFGNLIRLVEKGMPLPLGAVNNMRSVVALGNLVSFIVHCISHPKAANETFLISDDEDVSTTEIIKKTANALGKRVILVPVPISIMKFAARFIGKEDIANRLFSSLQIDSSKAKDLLGWKPALTMEEQFQKSMDVCLNEKTV